MNVKRNQIKISRVLAEDNDFLTLEVGKRDDVVYHLQQNEEGEPVGGDRFLTLLFVRNTDAGMEVWDPTVD